MDCLGCGGKCCKGVIEVYSTDSIYGDPTMTTSGFMKVTSENVCVALKDGLCSIYENRPEICREFKFNSSCCKDFMSGIKQNHDCSNECIYLNLNKFWGVG